MENYTANEFNETQNEFKKKIFGNKGEMGIQEELLNMRMLKYISGGKEGVQTFDTKLFASFADYQHFLMTDDRKIFNLDIFEKAKKMYEVLCHIENATDAFSVQRNNEWNKMINDCLTDIRMENIL